MMRAGRFLVVLIALRTGTSAAFAQTPRAREPNPLPATVLVAEQRCEPARYEPSAFYHLFEVELAALGVRARRLPEAPVPELQQALREAVAVVAVECDATSDVLNLRVSDVASGKELVRNLSVVDMAADERPRALALALVALIESSWSELLDTSAAAPSAHAALPEAVQTALRARLVRRLGLARSATAAPPAAEPRAQADKSTTTFEASVALRMFVPRSTALLGPQLGYSAALTSRLALLLDLEALWGRNDLSDALGTVGSMDLYWFAAGAVLAWRTPRLPMLELGPGFGLGYALADAHVARSGAAASNKSHALASGCLRANLHAPLSPGLEALLSVELGYTFVGILFLGDQARLAGMAGPSSTLRLGLAW